MKCSKIVSQLVMFTIQMYDIFEPKESNGTKEHFIRTTGVKHCGHQ